MAKFAIVKNNSISNYIVGNNKKECLEILDKLIKCDIIEKDSYIITGNYDDVTKEEKNKYFIITSDYDNDSIEENDYITYYNIVSNNDDYNIKSYSIGGYLIKSNNEDNTITLTNGVILTEKYIDNVLHYYDNNNEEWIEFSLNEYSNDGDHIDCLFSYGFFKAE